MNEYTISVKAGDKIVDAFSNVLVHPVIVAKIIHKAPGPIKRKVWETIKFVILHWKVEANRGTFDPSEKEIYEWARKVNDEQG
jgi:hypothetical protein